MVYDHVVIQDGRYYRVGEDVPSPLRVVEKPKSETPISAEGTGTSDQKVLEDLGISMPSPADADDVYSRERVATMNKKELAELLSRFGVDSSRMSLDRARLSALRHLNLMR